jgi:hypothetical protein
LKATNDMLPPSTLVPSGQAIEPLPLPDIPWLLLIGNPLSAPSEEDIGDEGNDDEGNDDEGNDDEGSDDEGNEEEISLLINSPKFP